MYSCRPVGQETEKAYENTEQFHMYQENSFQSPNATVPSDPWCLKFLWAGAGWVALSKAINLLIKDGAWRPKPTGRRSTFPTKVQMAHQRWLHEWMHPCRLVWRKPDFCLILQGEICRPSRLLQQASTLPRLILWEVFTALTTAANIFCPFQVVCFGKNTGSSRIEDEEKEVGSMSNTTGVVAL